MIVALVVASVAYLSVGHLLVERCCWGGSRLTRAVVAVFWPFLTPVILAQIATTGQQSWIYL